MLYSVGAALLTTILPSGIMGVEAAVTSAESGGSAHTTPFQQLWNSFAMPQVVQEYYDYFATEEGRKLVWGITIRLLAVVWIISLGSLIPQVSNPEFSTMSLRNIDGCTFS